MPELLTEPKLELFTVDSKIPYRLYVGGNKNVDWLDIKAIYNRKLEVIFEDNSPIEEIWELENYPLDNILGAVLLIKKAKSLWKYYHSYPFGRLILLFPKIRDEKIMHKSKLIYKRYA